MSAALEARTRAADPSVKSFVEVLTLTQAIYKRTKADWLLADSTAGFRIDDDGGVRLSTTIATQITTVVGAGTFSDLDRISPYRVRSSAPIKRRTTIPPMWFAVRRPSIAARKSRYPSRATISSAVGMEALSVSGSND